MTIADRTRAVRKRRMFDSIRWNYETIIVRHLPAVAALSLNRARRSAAMHWAVLDSWQQLFMQRSRTN